MPEEEVRGNLSETLARVVQIAVRRRWWIIISACFTPLATVAVLSKVPNRYTSTATLVVVQQQVPERYVVPNDTTNMSVALEAMKQEILSRTQLQRIILDFGLYPKQSKRLAPEEITSLMLRDIDIDPLENSQRDLNAFRISFTNEDPNLAQQITTRLTSLFVQENLKTREEQASNTTSFLHDQLLAAKKKLEAQEERLRDFKMQYLGELPEQQQGNLGVLSSLQTQLQSTTASISRAQEQRVYLESLLSGYQAMVAQNTPLPSPLSPGVTPSRPLTPLESAQKEADRLRAEKASLLVRFTERHPDVIRINHDIARAEASLKVLQSAAPPKESSEGPSAPSFPAPAQPAENPAVAQIRSQLEANRVELANLSGDEKRLKAAMAQYQSRLNLTPVREQQLTGILRDYDLQKKDYEDLVNKELQSQLATNLEKIQGGRRFRLIDPPSLPEVPTSPKRTKINLGGLAGGIALGLALAILMEIRDQSFHNESDIKARAYSTHRGQRAADPHPRRGAPAQPECHTPVGCGKRPHDRCISCGVLRLSISLVFGRDFRSTDAIEPNDYF